MLLAELTSQLTPLQGKHRIPILMLCEVRETLCQ